jgi:hypothetical protein
MAENVLIHIKNTLAEKQLVENSVTKGFLATATEHMPVDTNGVPSG